MGNNFEFLSADAQPTEASAGETQMDEVAAESQQVVVLETNAQWVELVLSLKAIERRLMNENPLPLEILRMFMTAVSEYQPQLDSTGVAAEAVSAGCAVFHHSVRERVPEVRWELARASDNGGDASTASHR